MKKKREVEELVEDETCQISACNTDDCLSNRKRGSGRLLRQTDATELGIKPPWWFRLLLKIPELPSIVYMPAIAGLFCYFLLPMVILFGYVVALVYIVLLVHSPLVYLLLAAIVAPLWLITVSAKAHAFWNYWQLLSRKRFVWDTDRTLEEYIALIQKTKKEEK